MIAGKEYSNLNRIESSYSVHVSLPSAKTIQKDILIKGSVAENVSAAKNDILEHLSGTLSMNLEKRLIGRIIGRRGDTVQSLCQKYGVKIFCKDGKARIVGSKDRTEAAREAIVSIISKEHKKTADAS